MLHAAHGADAAREAVIREIEAAVLTLLPDETLLPPTGIVVQPDATLISPNTHVLVEAKRIRACYFQAEQLPREYLALLLAAEARTPLLLVVLGAPPPVPLRGHRGRLPLLDALTLHLETVHNRVEGAPIDLAAGLLSDNGDRLARLTYPAPGRRQECPDPYTVADGHRDHTSEL
ncbi:MAG: hypothetical protein ACR2JK_01840 [Geodermatophilaceae bacterium]